MCGTETDLGDWMFDNKTSSCFFVSDQKYKWQAAKSFCRGLNATLATIDKDNYQMVREGLLWSTGISAPEERFWIGLILVDRLTLTHTWLDGNVSNTFRAWDINEPDRRGFQACTSMAARNGKWRDEHCSIPAYRLVCRKSTRPAANITKDAVPAKVRESWGCQGSFLNKSWVQFGNHSP